MKSNSGTGTCMVNWFRLLSLRYLWLANRFEINTAELRLLTKALSMSEFSDSASEISEALKRNYRKFNGKLCIKMNSLSCLLYLEYFILQSQLAFNCNVNNHFSRIPLWCVTVYKPIIVWWINKQTYLSISSLSLQIHWVVEGSSKYTSSLFSSGICYNKLGKFNEWSFQRATR